MDDTRKRKRKDTSYNEHVELYGWQDQEALACDIMRQWGMPPELGDVLVSFMRRSRESPALPTLVNRLFGSGSLYVYHAMRYYTSVDKRMMRKCATSSLKYFKYDPQCNEYEQVYGVCYHCFQRVKWIDLDVTGPRGFGIRDASLYDVRCTYGGCSGRTRQSLTE